jgi:acyl-coenzyme A thioesterase PaaI-like protein
MPASENSLKWVMRFYPPLFFQRIWVVKFDKDFRGVEVRIKKSLWNRNYNDSIFGGTIFAAADPFYPVLFYQVLSQKGYNIRAWAKSSEIKFLKPGHTHLSFKIQINEPEIIEAEEILNTLGKYTRVYPIDIYDKNGVHVASVLNEIYMRNLNFTDNAHSDK